LDAQDGETVSYADAIERHVSYVGAAGDRVPALIFEPRWASAEHPSPCLVLVNGVGGQKEMLTPVARIAASLGYASLLIDVPGQGERGPAGGAPGQLRWDIFPGVTTEPDLASAIVDNTARSVVDLRRGIDVVSQRKTIDGARIGVVGYSLGALVSTVLAAVDSRVKVVALMSGGGDLAALLRYQADANIAVGGAYKALIQSATVDAFRAQLSPIDPLNYVGHIAPRPLLIQHGKADRVIPSEYDEKLYDAAGSPKQIDLYPTSGHILPPLETFAVLSAFLSKNLPVTPS
jgi:dienelactone hydrolase